MPSFEPGDWPLFRERMFQVIDETFQVELKPWQRDALDRFFGDPAPFYAQQLLSRRLGDWQPSGPIERGPVGATLDYFVVDEIVEWPYERTYALIPADQDKAEIMNRVIDGVAEDVDAKIARLECPRFPRAD